ncbi:hypothetical protein AAFC00_000650 [Neodothiora populina]|uniref:4a-hydroxytetrahydrobiopterin dehydratase n=1 Tax=Neodothiora populina TaxID=2781224 RepID=A0ABR3PDJ7_9PEZI
MSTSTAAATSQPLEIQPSEGENRVHLENAVAQLIPKKQSDAAVDGEKAAAAAAAAEGGEGGEAGAASWELVDEGRGLQRTFRFRTFGATWDFMTQIATQCKKTRHHPEWSNVYNKTTIKWTTHRPLGLSSKDTEMARFCDEVARERGEVF